MSTPRQPSPGPRARRAPVTVALVTGALAACGGGGATPTDASPDTAPGTCGADVSFTGEIVDWDSTETKFCGVFNATWTVRGAPARTSTTAPNGRFQLCIPHQAQTVVDVVPSGAGSECPGLSGTAMNAYKLHGVAIASDAVLAAGGAYSARDMVEARMLTLATEIGGQLADDHGQLLVHVDGAPRAVAISASHGATQRFDGATWAAGDTGSDVFFPNVDLTGGAVSVTMTGTAIGTGSYTVDPGKLTYLSVIAR